jgi:hypothetical protein
MNKNKSFHDRVAAVVAGQKVEELKARHAYLHGMNRSREEYGTFWLRSDNSTFGHTFGRMMGYQELVPAHFGDPLRAHAFAAADDEDEGGMGKPMNASDDMPDEGMPFENASEKEFDRPTKMKDIYGKLNLYGHNPGTFGQSCHVLASPVIEVAEDGKSARSFYLTPGTMMGMNGPKGGRSGGFLWERYGSEFVYRDGRWWWFHEQVCPDIGDSYDASNWAQDRFRKYIAGKLNVGNCSGPPKSGISDLRQAHNDISIIQTVQDTVPAPDAYEKLDEAHTYSPGCAEFEDIYIYPAAKGFGDPIY